MKERIVTVNEAHDLLKSRQKEGNLSYEQQNTLNYLEDLIKLEDKYAQKLVKELKETGLSEWQAIKAVDILPKKEDEFKIILAGSGPVNDAALKKAFEILKEYRKNAKEPAKTKKVEPLPEVEKPTVGDVKESATTSEQSEAEKAGEQ